MRFESNVMLWAKTVETIVGEGQARLFETSGTRKRNVLCFRHSILMPCKKISRQRRERAWHRVCVRV